MLYWVEVGVGVRGVEDFVAVHYGDEVFGVAQVDDVVGVAREHHNRLDAVAAHLILKHFVGAFASHLDEAVALYHDELLPLAVVPVLALGDARPRDVDAHLSAPGGVHKLRERAALVAVHLQIEHGFLRRKVTQEGGHQPARETVGSHLGNHERPRHGGKAVEKLHNLAQRGVEGGRHTAVAAVGTANGVDALELAVVLTALQGKQHLVDEVVDVEQFEFDGRVIHLDRQAVGDVVAECRHCRVVVRPAPLAEEIREAVDEHLCACFFRIAEEKLLACLLALPVGMTGVTAYQSGLYRAAQHHRATVAMAAERVEKRRGEAEVALAEVVGVLGAVDAGQVEHEAGLRAPALEFLRRRVEIVLENIIYLHREAAQLAVADVTQTRAQVASNEALRSRYKYLHPSGFIGVTERSCPRRRVPSGCIPARRSSPSFPPR